MASEYIDRIVCQYFVPQFINTSYSCIEGIGISL